MDAVRTHLSQLLSSKALTLRGFADEMGASHHTVINVADATKNCQTNSITRAREALERLGHWPPAQTSGSKQPHQGRAADFPASSSEKQFPGETVTSPSSGGGQ